MIAIRDGEPHDTNDVAGIMALSGMDRADATQGHYHRLVAVAEDGSVVGFIDGAFTVPVPERGAAAADAPGRQAWGSVIAVHPDGRRRGVARALLRAFVLLARERGCTFFAAMVSWHDDHADRVAFFRQCGLRDLVPDRPDDLVGAPIEEILAAITD